MQRRDFSRSLLAAGATAITAAGGLTLTPALAQVAGLKEGSDYLRLGRPAPVDSPAGQVEVVEFFAYTCIHCFNFEPAFSDWIKKKPAHVAVRRVPVAFNEAFVPLQHLFYSLETLGQLDALHEKVFRAIHVEKQRILDEAAITAWVEKQGVNRAKFTEVFKAFSTAGKARRAVQLQDAYQVEGTPALGVAGRYYVPGQGPRTLLIANALVDEVRKG